jgi:vitamin B12 transporter
MRISYIPIITTALSLSIPVSAEENAAEHIETVVVTATRSELPITQIGQSISVLSIDDIELSQKAVLSDLLATLPGVTFSRNGGPGTATSIRIRGAEAAQTTVLIDGVKLNDPSSAGGGFNFGSLLAGNVARVEVLRGPQSVLWGSQAIGGVVNMITRQPTEDLSINGHVEAGSFGTFQGVGNISGSTDFIEASAGAGYFKSDSISAFSKELGGTEKDGYENFGANTKIKLTANDMLSFDIRAWYSSNEVNIDGFPPPAYAFADTLEFSKSKEFVGYAGANINLLDGRFTNRFAFTYTDTDRDNFNPDSTPERTFDAKGRNERFEYQGTFAVSDMLHLTAGAETEKSKMTTASPSSFDPNPTPTVGDARLNSVYGQAIMNPIENLTLIAGVRRDDHSTFGGETTFGASASYSPNDGKTRFKGSYSEGFKAPSLYQLQSLYGNPNLNPEEAEGWEAGIEQQVLGDRGLIGATWFTRTTTNQIGFVSCFGSTDPRCTAQPSGFYDNINRTKSDGYEFYLSITPMDGTLVRAQYTYTNPRNKDEGSSAFNNVLARRAKHTASLNVEHKWNEAFGTGASALYVGDSFDNASNSRVLENYVLVDIRATYQLNATLELYGRVENLFDEQYETTFRYGTQGRAGYIGLRVSL